MKRRVISFITALALCLGLCPTWAFADNDVTLDKDQSGGAYNITYIMRFNGGGHTYTVLNATAMVVQNGGQLFLSNGTVKSGNGAGVEVKNGGLLSVAAPDVTVTGTTYGLDIFSGALVQLSGGTFTATGTNGKAIRSADGYAPLLMDGYAFFDESGAPILLTEVAGKKTVTVQKCENHLYSYMANNDAPTHGWECLACGTKGTEPCTFNFDESDNCEKCSRALKITIDPDEKVYDGKLQPSSLSVQFKLDGKEITLDYTVDYTPRVDVGETTVIVTIVTYGWTIKKNFRVTQAQSKITWGTDKSAPITVCYDGDPVEKADLPSVIIKLGDAEKDWGDILEYDYFYREHSDDGSVDLPYTKGLPTNAGSYDIIVMLPGTENYTAAESDPITLTINKIDPIIEPPKAKENLIYNGEAQKLVDPGEIWDGAVIQFRLGEDGEWSEDVPTAVNAGDYHVYYKVDGTNNFTEVGVKDEEGNPVTVTIQRKQITPIVELENTSYVYTGGKIQPGVTVRDEHDYWNPLHSTEYEVTYYNNENVGTAYVIVSDREGGNYEIVPPDPEVKLPDGAPTDAPKGAIVTFEITPQDQAGLNIIGKPNSVSYGDEFTLNVSGGSGNGTVTWEIIAAVDSAGNPIENEKDFAKVAEIDSASGQVTVNGLGTVTVQAKKTGSDYKETTAQWEFTVGPKRVTATVTAKNKIYDGNADAVVTAVVEPGDLVSADDKIEITGLSGTFSDANAGTNKAVTVYADSCQIDQYEIDADGEKNLVVKASEKYIVIIPSTPVRADITKAETKVKTPPSGKQGGLTYDGNAKDLVEAGTAYLAAQIPSDDPEDQEKTETVTVLLEYALSESGTYSTEIPKATNAGSYEVWYRVRATDNYFGTTAQKVDVTIGKKPVTAYVTLDNDSYAYDGKAKEPAVTVKETDANGAVISPAEYTVTYSNNTNVGKAKTQDENGTAISFDPNAPAVTVTAKADGNYEFNTVKKNFEITTGGKASLTKSPDPKNLTYNGQEQELVTAGTATGGHLEYALANQYAEDGTPIPDTGSTSSPPTDYKSEIPRGKDAGEYIVYYKVVGDGNYEDSGVSYVYVTIQPKKVTSPDITLPEKTFTYSGSAQTYTTEEAEQITVKDGGTTIDPGEYTVTYSNNINAGTATLHINDKNGGNYDVSGSTTFTINKAEPTVNKPTKKEEDLKYNGTAQVLIDRGSSPHGKMMYSLDDENYFEDVPTAVAVGSYNVYYKVLGDSNHKDSTAATVSASIVQNTVNNPTITLSSDTFRYNGSQQKPTITVRDDDNLLIPDYEYEVKITGAKTGNNSTVIADTYTITITTPSDSNYVITTEKDGNGEPKNERTYKIVEADQEAISITGMRDQVYYGDKIQLGITGGTGEGKVTWKIEKKAGTDSTDEPSGTADDTGGTSNEITENGGLLTINEVGGPYVVTATRTSSSGNYDTITTTWEFSTSAKPITAVLTGVDREYKEGDRSAVVEAKVDPRDLVDGDEIIIKNLDGEFEDANVGTNKKITITTAKPVVSGQNSDKYDIIYPKTAAADIKAKEIKAEDIEITLDPPLLDEYYVYDGNEKTPGVTVTYNSGVNEEGNDSYVPLLESDYTVTYSNNINAGTATVTVKNVTGGNYRINVTEHFTIVKATPTVIAPVGKPDLTYTGVAQALLQTKGSSPHGTMMYKLEGDTDFSEVIPMGTAAGTYTVYYKVKGDSNHKDYEDNTPITVTIEKANQADLTITGIPSVIYKGETFTPIVSGGSGKGAITWGVAGVAEKDPDNSDHVKVTGVGSFTITAKRVGDDNYEDISTTWTFTAYPAQLTQEDLTKDYGITVTANELTYNGGEQKLITVVNPGTKTLKYSRDGINYDQNIPKETNAGTYTVWYKLENDDRIGSVEVTITKATPEIDVYPTASSITKGQPLSKSTITGGSVSYKAENEDKNVSGTFTWMQDITVPLVTARFAAIFTPHDDTNFESVSLTIRVEVVDTSSSTTGGGTSTSGGTTPQTPTQSGTETASTQTTVKDGASSTVMNDAAGDKLVDEAVANQSDAVIIKPEITGDVTKTEVSIPTSAVSRISSETNAALTISTPVADVTIPNEALGTLSGTGGAVSVVTERVENTVVLTLTADGKDVGDIPLTLTVPVEEAGPGTVAVLVYEDGTRETIRKSVAGEDGVRIPLNGSATVEIVDNRKEFTDVSVESWAADAVAFVSAHELFTGTAEATFSPELSMSRAMLTTVLHNLEGNPDQSLTAVFHDIGSGAWYEESVSWAVASGIVEGYGNGVFGPNDSITREQSIVMLWRYLGSPAAGEQILNFMDADQVSSYAMEALCWAASNGIVSGHGDGYLDPGGLATRAQAAQLLKNFIENT